MTGVAGKVGPDVHQKPSIELSTCAGGACHVLCVFPDDAHYSKVSPGDRVTVRGNYLILSEQFGVVLKFSELMNVQRM